jgi:glycosyltransferase involved in cell wall biosynthesis
MASENSSSIRLTIVTPIALMAGRLQNLESWISSMGDLPVEVILIHDKKDERTGIEVRELVNRLDDSRITTIEGLFGGPGLARNAGLEIAKGEWICFWDSDDLPQVEDFYKMVDSAAESGAEYAVGGFTAVHDVTSEKKSHTLTQNYLDEIAINPGIWRFAFKRSALQGLLFSKLLMAEDQLFLAKFGIPSRRVEISTQSVYQYFLGENFHLTRSKAALRDLPTAVSNSLSLIGTLSKVNVRFASILLSRQMITALRTGNISTRLQVLKILLSGLPGVGRSSRKEIFKSMWFVIWNREAIL